MKIVLVAQNSEVEVSFMKQAFAISGIPHRLAVVREGKGAIDYLSGIGVYENRNEHPFPAVVFLGLDLTGVSGFDLLSWIRSQAGVRHVPIIMLTLSDTAADIKRAFELGATSCLNKCTGVYQFTFELRIILRYHGLMMAP